MRDVRKFGKVRLLDPGEREPRLEKLGVDALLATGEQLFRATRGRKVEIKSLLLNQSCIAGVGNIYADECLFLARVRPTRRARRVTRKECNAVIEALHRILERAIESGGSSISDYISPTERTQLPERAPRLRKGRRALSGVRQQDPEDHDRTARHPLLRQVPAVRL